MKTNHGRSWVAHPIVALLALIIAPVSLYHWANRLWEDRVKGLEAPIAGREGQPLIVRDLAQRMVHAPGIRPPALYRADQVPLSASDEVVGIIINGQPRAYLLEAMRDLLHSVVNDVVGGRPVSIVRDANEGQVRVLVARKKRRRNYSVHGEPSSLPVGIAGEIGGQLLFSYRGEDYFVGEEAPGLTDYPHARCTWASWREAYPETDVYVGELYPGAD